jgi:transposase
VAYVFTTGLDTEAIVAQLGDRCAGVTQVDGYGAYKALAWRANPGRIRLAFCLAQARRKFVAVHKTEKGRFGPAPIDGVTLSSNRSIPPDFSRLGALCCR